MEKVWDSSVPSVTRARTGDFALRCPHSPTAWIVTTCRFRNPRKSKSSTALFRMLRKRLSPLKAYSPQTSSFPMGFTPRRMSHAKRATETRRKSTRVAVRTSGCGNASLAIAGKGGGRRPPRIARGVTGENFARFVFEAPFRSVRPLFPFRLPTGKAPARKIRAFVDGCRFFALGKGVGRGEKVRSADGEPRENPDAREASQIFGRGRTLRDGDRPRPLRRLRKMRSRLHS